MKLKQHVRKCRTLKIMCPALLSPRLNSIGSRWNLRGQVVRLGWSQIVHTTRTDVSKHIHTILSFVELSSSAKNIQKCEINRVKLVFLLFQLKIVCKLDISKISQGLVDYVFLLTQQKFQVDRMHKIVITSQNLLGSLWPLAL